jgi:DNA-binding response OmpR family regulator
MPKVSVPLLYADGCRQQLSTGGDMAIIWLVEDDVGLAKLTKIALVKKGYNVTVFHEANNIVEEAEKQKPDLILMDVMLPGLSGGEAVQALRKNPKFSDIPVIFMTALLSKEESELGLTIDNVNYKTLGKPFEIKHVLEMVESYLH